MRGFIGLTGTSRFIRELNHRGPFREYVPTHQLFGREFIACSFNVTYTCGSMLSLKVLHIIYSECRGTYSEQRDHIGKTMENYKNIKQKSGRGRL